jgi:hypothetical protein
MSLADLQRGFLAAVASDSDAAPATAGMAVYRNAYRARLIEALRGTYERVHAWLGDTSFDAAAAHHAILHPPHSWTLDAAGEGFPQTLAMLFPRDAEVEELAWLDACLARVLTAADEPAVTAADFADRVADYDDDDWTALRLRLSSALTIRSVRTNVAPLWTALAGGGEVPPLQFLPHPVSLAVWRDGLVPRFRTLPADETDALTAIMAGATFGDICGSIAATCGDDGAAERAGMMLGRWIADGLVLRSGPAPRAASLAA